MWGTYKRIRLLKWAHILPINPFFKCPWMVVTRSSRVVIMKINLEPQSHPCRLWCFQVCLHNVRTSLEPKWEKIQIWLRSVWTYVNKQKKTKQKNHHPKFILAAFKGWSKDISSICTLGDSTLFVKMLSFWQLLQSCSYASCTPDVINNKQTWGPDDIYLQISYS